MWETLSVSISGCRAWKRGGRTGCKRPTDGQMLALIQAIHQELKGAYESPRMVKEIHGRGLSASKVRVERLMRENGIRARHKRRFKVTTDARHNLSVEPNLLARDFSPKGPNQVWTADLTYVWIGEDWLYLAEVLDLFNREVVGSSIKPRMTADILANALTMAWFRRRPMPGLIHHSDRGSQYASHFFQAKLAAYHMICSMSHKGSCWDNAPTESFFNSMKNERVHGTRCATRDDAIADLFDYIEVFYNRSRRHSTLDYVSPIQFLHNWISNLSKQKWAA